MINYIGGKVETKIGHYGQGTPDPVEYEDAMYEATTISFVAETETEPAKLQDSAYQFSDKHIRSGMEIRIETTSGTNDGDYTIGRGVSRDEILLNSSASLTTEDAATAGTVTISQLIYKPDIGTGCPLCGSLNSR